jgi:hypothetical protein
MEYKEHWDQLSLLTQFNILREVVIGLLDGNSDWREIQKQTGLSEERCKEIEDIYLALTQGDK